MLKSFIAIFLVICILFPFYGCSGCIGFSYYYFNESEESFNQTLSKISTKIDPADYSNLNHFSSTYIQIKNSQVKMQDGLTISIILLWISVGLIMVLFRKIEKLEIKLKIDNNK